MGTLEGYVEGMINLNGGGGGGGTSDYEDLENKPSINGVTLSGNKTTSDLNVSYNDLLNKPYINNMPTSTGADIGDVLTHTSDGDEWAAPEKELPVISAADEGKILKIINGVPTWVTPSSGYSEAILWESSGGLSFNGNSQQTITLSDNLNNYKMICLLYSDSGSPTQRSLSIYLVSQIDTSGTIGFWLTPLMPENSIGSPCSFYVSDNQIRLNGITSRTTMVAYKIIGIKF
jgi:hypothetical protein